MPRKFKMTWFPPRQCWYGKKNGRRYYSPIKCRSKTTDWDGYARSLEWWEVKQKELEQSGLPTSAAWPPLTVEDRRLIKQLTTDSANPRTAEDATLMVYGWKEDEEIARTCGFTESSRAAYLVRERLADLLPQDRKIEYVVKRFLDFKVSQAVAGMKSAGRAINLVTYLKQFKSFVGGDRPITDITAATLQDYYTKTMNDIGTGQLTDGSGRDRLQVAKQFIRWAWEQNLIELPRNINSKELTIYVEQKEIKVFQFNALRTLITNAPEPLKLYLLLMANCGMTAMDVGDLRQSEFDANAGTISRVRSKRNKKRDAASTARNAKVKVTWKLWPTTLDLLLRHSHPSREIVLTNGDGGRLAYTTIDPQTHKGCDVDLIDKAYRKHCRALKMEDEKILPLKAIRATSATQIGTHPEYARFAQYFLGQSPRSVAEKFYVKPSQDQFNECVLWLGHQYGLCGST